MALAVFGGREETRSFLLGATALILLADFGGAEERVFALVRAALADRFTPAFSIALPCFPNFLDTRRRDGRSANTKTSEIALSLWPALTPFDGVVKFFDIAKRGWL